MREEFLPFSKKSNCQLSAANYHLQDRAASKMLALEARQEQVRGWRTVIFTEMHLILTVSLCPAFRMDPMLRSRHLQGSKRSR